MSAGAGDNQNLMVSDDQYLNVIVFFWKIIYEEGKRKLLCHGALIASNWIFATKKCHEIISDSDCTVLSTGGSYFEDIDIDFVIKSTIKFDKRSQFVILIVSSIREY